MKRRNFLTASALGILGIQSVKASGYVYQQIINKKRNQIIKTKVLVVGGGPAGIGAAIGAAKTGVETLVLENYGFFGGVASWGLGMCMNQMRPHEEPRGFVHELLLQKLQEYGSQAVRISTHQFYVNVDYMKAAVLDALDEVGCKYLVHARVVDTFMEGNRIKGVIISTKSGLTEVRADVVVDCTGDADVAFFAGAPTLKEIGNLSPQTMLFNVANMNTFESGDMDGVGEKARVKYPLVPKNWSLKRFQTHIITILIMQVPVTWEILTLRILFNSLKPNVSVADKWFR